MSNSPANNGTVVACQDKEQGRWHRVEDYPINVKWFGAKGDGANSTVAFQAALDAASGGGTVQIPTGQYLIDKPLRVYQGTTVLGDGLLSLVAYVGEKDTGCFQSATPTKACAFHFSRINVEVKTQGAWGIDLRGMSFSRFDHISIHLRKQLTSGYYGPSDGQTPYYNVFTGCHVAGPGNEDTNGCVAFNFTFDTDIKRLAPNANQVLGGHINSVQTAVACFGTGNVFYGQVIEQCRNGYVFGLPHGRLQDTSTGTVNCVAGCYTEYVKRVIVQEHETCVVNAELTHTTGYETVFHGKTKKNSIVLTTHDGRLEASRSFINRMIEVQVDGQ
ncbi:MAG: hypothetical protein CMJ78_07380 [Planctomycetaceae bacterium]|nr:hypothetical protein [Planctomycetaceae bacterium]